MLGMINQVHIALLNYTSKLKFLPKVINIVIYFVKKKYFRT